MPDLVRSKADADVRLVRLLVQLHARLVGRLCRGLRRVAPLSGKSPSSSMSFSSSPGPTAPATPTTILGAVYQRSRYEMNVSRVAPGPSPCGRGCPSRAGGRRTRGRRTRRRRSRAACRSTCSSPLRSRPSRGRSPRGRSASGAACPRARRARCRGLARAAHVVARDLLAGERAELAADGVDLRRDVARRRATLRPLKNMCSAKCAMPLDSRVS